MRTRSSFLSADSWYPRDEDYWFDPATADAQPLRMGDLVGVELEGWFAGLVTHPTCEIPKRRTQQIQVVRVRRLDDLGEASQQERIILGFEVKEGAPRPAFAHTFYVAPVTSGADRTYERAMYADFNDVALAAKVSVLGIASMTHDCRLSLIRRKIYYRYRWLVDIEDVRRWEAHRISNDPRFPDPRPDWAPLACP
jgi:hypothetical protein